MGVLKLQLPKNRIQYLIQQAPKRFDASTLERGWDYFHKGRIAQAELRYGTLIYASVLGSERKSYEVTLDIESFENSECSCPDDEMCEHIASVIFYLYAPYGRPELLLQELRQTILTRSRASRSAAAKAERQDGRAIPPEPPGPAAEWQRFFEQRFYGFSVSHQYSIDSFYESAWQSLNAFTQGWHGETLQLYRIHIILFMLRKIEQFYLDTKASYLSYYHETGSKQTAAQCVEKLQEITADLKADTFKECSKLWRETLELLGEWALHGKDSPVDWLYVYRYIWWQVPLEEWRRREAARLDGLLAKQDIPARRRDALTLARLHFDFIEKSDSGALPGRLESLTSLRPGDFFIYLQAAHAVSDTETLLLWLRRLKPAMAAASQDDFRTLCQYWTDAVHHLDTDAEWVAVMESLLPRSYNYYTAYLLQTQRYRQWVDLQLANRISPLNLYVAELKAVEKQDPALLLPLYHQAVERSILEKNRTSYKIALKLLKKLQAYYKQLGREVEWERYIHRLAMKFARLRAFQEELKRTGYAATPGHLSK